MIKKLYDYTIYDLLTLFGIPDEITVKFLKKIVNTIVFMKIKTHKHFLEECHKASQPIAILLQPVDIEQKVSMGHGPPLTCLQDTIKTEKQSKLIHLLSSWQRNQQSLCLQTWVHWDILNKILSPPH